METKRSPGWPLAHREAGSRQCRQEQKARPAKIKEVDPNCEVWITERGSNFGYDRLIVDFRGVDVMKEFADKVILDCTHSTQMTGEGITRGSRKLAKQYAHAAQIYEYDGVFIETHPDPSNAISDSESQVELDWLVSQINII